MSDDLKRAADEFEGAAQGVGNEMNQAARDVADSLSEAADKGAALAAEAAHAATDAAHAAADQAQQSAEGAGKAAKSTVDDIVEGVERVSTQVADSARHFWESDQRKEVQDSVVKGLSGLASAIEEQTKKIAANPETQKVVGRMEEVADKVADQVRSSKTMQDLAEGIMKGLTALAASIEGWLSSQKPHAADESTDIVPIEDARLEPPTVQAVPPVSFDDPQTVDIEKPE